MLIKAFKYLPEHEKILFQNIAISKEKTDNESRLRVDLDSHISKRLHNLPALQKDIDSHVKMLDKESPSSSDENSGHEREGEAIYRANKDADVIAQKARDLGPMVR